MILTQRAPQRFAGTSVFFLREHAAADGTLPASFDGLVNDVFGPLPPLDG